MAVAGDLHFLVVRIVQEPGEDKVVIVTTGGKRRRAMTAPTTGEGELDGKGVEGKAVGGGREVQKTEVRVRWMVRG